MNSLSLDSFLNTSFIDAIKIYWDNVSGSISNILNSVRDNQSKTFVTAIGSLPDSFNFDEFQWKLLKGFLTVLLINLLLICIAWKIYGKNICERFMKPATSKAIEELKASVSKLKLPKEHTPRI